MHIHWLNFLVPSISDLFRCKWVSFYKLSSISAYDCDFSFPPYVLHANNHMQAYCEKKGCFVHANWYIFHTWPRNERGQETESSLITAVFRLHISVRCMSRVWDQKHFRRLLQFFPWRVYMLFTSYEHTHYFYKVSHEWHAIVSQHIKMHCTAIHVHLHPQYSSMATFEQGERNIYILESISCV